MGDEHELTICRDITLILALHSVPLAHILYIAFPWAGKGRNGTFRRKPDHNISNT